jgi:hypothetical protein
MHGIVDPVLAFLHLDFGRPTDADHRYPASELGEPLLQLLAIIVRSRLFDLRLDLVDAALDVLLLAGAVDDRGVLLVSGEPLRCSARWRTDRTRGARRRT